MKNSTVTSILFLLVAFAIPASTYGQNKSHLLVREFRSMQQAGIDTFSLELNECAAITRPLRERAVAMLSEIRSVAMEDRMDLSQAQSDAMSCMYCPSHAEKREQHCDSLGSRLDDIEMRWRQPVVQPAQDLTPW